jgi:hypothetical protein
MDGASVIVSGLVSVFLLTHAPDLKNIRLPAKSFSHAFLRALATKKANQKAAKL